MTFEVHAYAAARRPERQRRRSGPVTVMRVNPALWEAALRAAEGDARRLMIVSATTVIVTNNGDRQWPKLARFTAGQRPSYGLGPVAP